VKFKNAKQISELAMHKRNDGRNYLFSMRSNTMLKNVIVG